MVVDGRAVRLTLATAARHGQAVAVRYVKPGSGSVLRDGSGEAAAGFVEVVDNDTPPALTGARSSTDGRAVTLGFDAALAGAAVPARAAFSVTVDGSARTPSGVVVDGAAVTLALAAALSADAAVTVSYVAPDAAAPRLQDAAGLAVAGFSERAVENRVDVSAPRFESAATTVDGGAVTVVFDEALAGASVPAPGAFSVTVDGAARTPSGVAVAGRAVTLGLASAVVHGEAVTVGYTKPARGAVLGDAAGNAVASFAGETVRNATPHPDAPVVRGVAFSSDAGPDELYGLGEAVRVRLAFDRPVHVAGAPRLKLRLRAGDERWASYESGSGTARLVFAWEVAEPATAPGVEVLADTLEGNGGAIRSVTGNVDAVLAHAGLGPDANHRVDWRFTAAPRLVSAGVNAAALTLTFSAYLDAASKPAPGAFEVMVGTVRRTVAAGGVAIAGEAVTLTLASAVARTDAVTVAYTKPATGALSDRAGAEVASFGAATVSNDGTAPSLVRAQVSRDRLTMEFDEPLALAGALANGAFVVRRTPARGARETVALAGAPSIVGSRVTLALAGAVRATDTRVTVSYTRPGTGSGNRLRDAAGNEVASFADWRSVVNRIPGAAGLDPCRVDRCLPRG